VLSRQFLSILFWRLVFQLRRNFLLLKCLGAVIHIIPPHRPAITTKVNVQPVAEPELTRLTQEAGIFPDAVRTFPKGQ
jgi:hypothetical protein